MAKIDINFNDKNYTIDEASLSSASATLRTHLSTVMNGTGAVINLGGTSYGVDSAKLATATNAFVSHLGTIAGSGYKVMVGDVEYGVGTDKVSGAVAELETVLGGLNSGDVELPEVGVDVSTGEITDTWSQITQAIEEGSYNTRYAVGNYKTFSTADYGDVTMEIVAFDTDSKTDGTTAAISWVSKNIITTRAMNSTETSNGGWEGSELRNWLKTDFYSAIPEDVKNSIVNVNKTYCEYTTSKLTKTCVDDVWIPSFREIFGVNYDNVVTCEESGVIYKTHFNSNSARIKKDSSDKACNWWLRSTNHYKTKMFEAVTANGGAVGFGSGDYAIREYGVVLGFCM